MNILFSDEQLANSNTGGRRGYLPLDSLFQAPREPREGEGDTAVKRLSMRETLRGDRRFEKAVRTAASCCELEAKFSLYFNEVHRR